MSSQSILVAWIVSLLTKTLLFCQAIGPHYRVCLGCSTCALQIVKLKLVAGIHPQLRFNIVTFSCNLQ